MRSLLFAGATRPDLVAKLPRSRPDAVVVDLEDAVPSAHKASARTAARELAAELAADHPWLDVYVRVNGPGTPWIHADVEQALGAGIAGVVVPKIERWSQVTDVLLAMERAGVGHLRLIAGIETPRGVQNVDTLVRPPLLGVYFGAEDYIAGMGGRRTREGREVLYARSRVVLAARVAGIVAIDQAVVDVRDDERYREDAEEGRALGFGGKLCVHPAQVPLAHAAFSPSPEEVEAARRLVDAWERGAASGRGAIEHDGAMVDAPALRLARRTLETASAPGA